MTAGRSEQLPGLRVASFPNPVESRFAVDRTQERRSCARCGASIHIPNQLLDPQELCVVLRVERLPARPRMNGSPRDAKKIGDLLDGEAGKSANLRDGHARVEIASALGPMVRLSRNPRCRDIRVNGSRPFVHLASADGGRRGKKEPPAGKDGIIAPSTKTRSSARRAQCSPSSLSWGRCAASYLPSVTPEKLVGNRPAKELVDAFREIVQLADQFGGIERLQLAVIGIHVQNPASFVDGINGGGIDAGPRRKKAPSCGEAAPVEPEEVLGNDLLRAFEEVCHGDAQYFGADESAQIMEQGIRDPVDIPYADSVGRGRLEKALASG